MQKLLLSDYQKIKPYLDDADYEGYNSNFVTMMMWDHEYEIYYEIKDHFIRRTYFGTGSGDGSGSLGCHDSIIQTEYYDGGRDT